MGVSYLVYSDFFVVDVFDGVFKDLDYLVDLIGSLVVWDHVVDVMDDVCRMVFIWVRFVFIWWCCVTC